VSQFNALLERNKEPAFYGFDFLWLDSSDRKGVHAIACCTRSILRHMGLISFRNLFTRLGWNRCETQNVDLQARWKWLDQNKSYSQAEG